jgi:acyl-CoA thioesterase-2
LTPTETSELGFAPLLELAPHGPDTYVGVARRYPFEGLYGGQVVAQALRAAGLTVKAGYVPHSLHAYFLRMGDPSEPVRFEVERLRDGRSFIARQVVARQSSGAILNMSASFQSAAGPGGGAPAGGAGPVDVQLARMPEVAPPEEGEDLSWSPVFELRLVRGRFGATGRWLDGPVGGGRNVDGRGGDGRDVVAGGPSCSWLKVREPLPKEPSVHAAALAYESDSGPAWVVGALHETADRPQPAWRPVSLDHAMWFHRPFRADDWLLFRTCASSLRASRGLAQGQVFSADGALVASVSQEVLLRRAKLVEGSV